ncbi:hypothetical protein D3C79_524960 [compost metagenome]
MAAGIEHPHRAFLAIDHVNGLGQRRVAHRQRVRADLQGLHQAHVGDIDDAQGAAVAVADEGVARVGAERDLVVPGAGGEGFQRAAAGHVDHRHSAFGRIAAVVADPQAVLVRLQDHAQRLHAGIQVGDAGEGFGVDHRHLAALGDRHEHQLVVTGGRPVHRLARQFDARQGAGDAAHRDRRVDHGQAGVLVQHEQEVAVEVEQWPGADAALEEQRHAGLAALVAAADRGRLRRVDPRPWRHARQRLAAGLVADFEADAGEVAFTQLAAGQRPGLELHGHAVPAEPVQGLRVVRALQILARIAPEAFIGHAQADQHCPQCYPHVCKAGFLVHVRAPIYRHCAGAVAGGASLVTRKIPHSPERLP